jgi:hypothetical protein
MLAFFKKAISFVFRGDWLFQRECSSSGTQSRSKSCLNLNSGILATFSSSSVIFCFLFFFGGKQIDLNSHRHFSMEYSGCFWDGQVVFMC